MAKGRAGIGDRLLAAVGMAHARRVYERFQAATRRAAALQEEILLDKIRCNADSDFGRDHHFDRIRSADDFRRQLPVLTYEEHRPYIERVKAGDARALFGGRQRVRMFALTSGTTDQPKFIPVTDAFLNEYRTGWNAFGIKALLDHPEAILRRIAQVSSRMDESRTSGGIACGAITGLMAATQKFVVRKHYITPGCLAEIDDSAAKYYTVMRLAVPADVAFVIAASPATQLKLARTAEAQAASIIRDVHDGALRSDLPISGAVRRQLAPRLKPDPFAARRLEALLHEHGRLLPKHYWNLAFLANWTGGTMGLYLQDFPAYFGNVPVRDVGLLASEGRMSIPIDDGTPAGILDVTSHFFEFIPRDQRGAAQPTVLRSHELQTGEEYFILLTTSSGLYRYDIGDLIRVVGYHGEAPLIEFLNKGDHVCSLAGEKLTEHQVVLAMERACAELRTAVPHFILLPQWAHPPGYLLCVDEDDARQTELSSLAVALERKLNEVNVEYASKRQSDRLGPVQAAVLPPGTLARLDQHCAGRHRKGNEQFKHQYLYCRPGEAEALLAHIGGGIHAPNPPPSSDAPLRSSQGDAATHGSAGDRSFTGRS